LSNTPAEEQSGKAPRLPGGRLMYERGIRYSNLPAPSRHLALTIATWADVETGIIPARFQPAKGVLEEATGLSRGAIVKHLNLLEEQGWISRETGGGAGRRTKFRLRIPAGAKTGHHVTPSVSENGSPHDPFAENGSPREQKTGHVVNKNGSPGDPKSSLNPYESLSLVDEPEPTTPEPPAAPSGERETIATRQEPTPLSAAQRAVRAARVVAEADEQQFIDWITRTHNPRGPGWWRTVSTAGDLPDLAAAWQANRTNAPSQPAGPALTEPCARCEDADPAARFNTRLRRSPDGGLCPDCHPDAVPAAA